MKLSNKEFDQAVLNAINRIPQSIRGHLQNIIISVCKWPSPQLLEELGLPPGEPLLGIYRGNALANRSVSDTATMPDTILIFQGPLEQMCEELHELEEQIAITVIHEIAHFLGIEEDKLAELGYD